MKHTTDIVVKCEAPRKYIYKLSSSKEINQYNKIVKDIEKWLGSYLKYEDDIIYFIENLFQENLNITEHTKEYDISTNKLIWKKEIKENITRKKMYLKNTKTIYSLPWYKVRYNIKERLERKSTFLTLRQSHTWWDSSK